MTIFHKQLRFESTPDNFRFSTNEVKSTKMQTALPKGTYIPLVTPFTRSGNIDYESFDKLIGKMLKAKVEALVVLGTTGESPTVTPEETYALIEYTVARVNGSATVLAGVGNNDTQSSLTQAQSAMNLGVDGLLVVCPYYSRPNQQGLYEHFKLIAEQVPIPQIVYNIAGRTGVNIELATLLELSKLANIVGVKESSDDITQINDVLQKLPNDFLVLCGCDHLNFATLCLGGHGVISTVANLVPEKIKAMVDAALSDDVQSARQLHVELQALVTGCSIDSNPIPVKTALAMMGCMEELFRLPLCAMEPDIRHQWSSILEHQGLLKTADNENITVNTRLGQRA